MTSRQIAVIFFATATLAVGVGSLAQAAVPETSCQKGRYAAAAKYTSCEQGARAKFYAGGTAGAHAAAAAKCQKKYTSTWAKLQAKASGTGSSCDAPRFLDGGTTVTDRLTGLQWEKTTDDATIHDKDNVYTLSTGFSAPNGTAYTSFLATLNGGACFAGRCDWRLPTIDELPTILQSPFQCFTSPCIDESLFGPTTATEVYWSSTNDAHQLGGGVAWYVFFHDGLMTVDLKSNANAVRAVRGGL